MKIARPKIQDIIYIVINIALNVVFFCPIFKETAVYPGSGDNGDFVLHKTLFYSPLDRLSNNHLVYAAYANYAIFGAALILFLVQIFSKDEKLTKPTRILLVLSLGITLVLFIISSTIHNCY
jgi:hypothetical protein